MARNFWIACALASFGVLMPLAAQNAPVRGAAQTSASATPAGGGDSQEQLLKSAEAFIRDLYAWGPDFKLSFGPLTQAPLPDFYKVRINVSFNGQSDSGEVFVSKDGKTFLHGEIFDMRHDPFADTRAKLNVAGNPSVGPDDAPVTVVEFADFQCPHCREFHEAFAAIREKFPQVKLVYKDFPLTTIHPWAETAAIGARCAFQQSPAAFWKMHDAIFNDQQIILPSTISDKLVQYATDEGLNADQFKACVASPEAAKAVDANHADGMALGVNSTPTVYVNGRAVVGGDPAAVAQYIQYELSAHAKQP